MSKPRTMPDDQGFARDARASDDMMLVAARQERQRAEIQAKLNTMLDALRFPAATKAVPRVPPLAELDDAGPSVTLPNRTSAPLERKTAAVEAAPEPSVSLLRRIEDEWDLPGEGAPAVLELQRQPASAPVVAAAALVPSLPTTVAIEPVAVSTPTPVEAWQPQLEALSRRLDRLEAASVAAATTIDGLVSSFDHGQKTTFSAAQASAREEARAIVAQEVRPALAELDGVSTHARDEIHGVLSLLGTCLERVVGHLQKLEGMAAAVSSQAAPAPAKGEPAPAAVEQHEPAPFVAPVPVATEPPLLSVTSAPSVPLPGFGRRSKFAALIDFGFGTRAA